MDKLNEGSELGGQAKRIDSLRSPQRLGGSAEQLLPGLQNDLVLDHIVPKLPWKAFYILSSVSPYWRDAIRSRQVRETRARLNSMETLVVMNHLRPDDNSPDDPDDSSHVISLYSSREDSWHQLPEFPYKEIPESCHCVALEGSLYVLGGDLYTVGSVCVSPDSGIEMFVLDLVGQRGWKRCANLPVTRFAFGCGAVDGKVYVLGGRIKNNSINECWVYDPKEDRWSSIAPMLSKRSAHQVVAVGDELWVHGGYRTKKALYPEVYNPAKDEWACVEPQHPHDSGHLFTMKGKPYLITPDCIYGREESSKGKCWTKRQSIGYCTYPRDNCQQFRIAGARVVDHEILVMFVFVRAFQMDERALYRSEGFGMGWMGKERVYLRMVEKKIFDDLFYTPVMCPINL